MALSVLPVFVFLRLKALPLFSTRFLSPLLCAVLPLVCVFSPVTYLSGSSNKTFLNPNIKFTGILEKMFPPLFYSFFFLFPTSICANCNTPPPDETPKKRNELKGYGQRARQAEGLELG